MSAVNIGTLQHLRFRFFCCDATVCHAEASTDIFVTHASPFVRAIDEAQKRLRNEVPLHGITDAVGHQVRNADTGAALIRPLVTLSRWVVANESPSIVLRQGHNSTRGQDLRKLRV